MADSVEEYLVQLVLATRHPGRYDNSLERLIEYGASPRATIALDRCARARAWLLGRDFVSPEDVLALAPDVLRHRIIPVLRLKRKDTRLIASSGDCWNWYP
jgi:MoxR-like ATPase